MIDPDEDEGKLYPVPTIGEAMPALREIVEQKTMLESVPGGLPVDLFSASAIVSVYDALGPEARTRFEALRLLHGQAVAFKLIKRMSS